jgi:tRNA (pseudouridine54-N1)-methyltransferase
MKAGRMDIVCNVIIHAFFLSHELRENVSLHLVFYGQPTPPRHLELKFREKTEVSKKDISGLLKRMLYKYKEGKKTEVFPGCFVEKKSFLDVVNELAKEGKKIYVLDKGGGDIRKISDEKLKNAVFILGSEEGLPRKEMKRLKQKARKISVGKKTYFASQVLTIVHNELDRRGGQ